MKTMHKFANAFDIEIERTEGVPQPVIIKYLATYHPQQHDEAGGYEIDYSVHHLRHGKPLPDVKAYVEHDDYYHDFITDRILEDLTFNHV